MQTEKRETRRRWLWAAALFTLTFLRYLYYGFSYYFQLDDYIQHHNYAAFSKSMWDTIERVGLIGSRPLAGIFDIGVWSKFWGFMIAAVAILTICYTAAAMLYGRVFERRFGLSPLFYVAFLLVPFNFEGSYWMSAATRTLMGLVFAAACLYLYDRFFDAQRRRGCWLAGALVCGFLAGCFYEQALTLAVGSVLVLSLFRVRRLKARALWGALSLGDLALYFAVTAAFSANSINASRTSAFLLPSGKYYYQTFLPLVLEQMKSVLIDGPYQICVRGLRRGAQIIAADPNWIWLLAAALLLAGFCALALRRRTSAEQSRGRMLLALPFGALLVLAALSPFFVIDNPWLSLRGTVMALPGLALMLDRLLALVLSFLPRGRRGLTVGISALLAGCCMVASVSELHDYRETYLNDQRAGSALAEELNPLPNELDVAVFGLEPTYLEEQNFFYHEHIHGTTESDWAFTGMLTCISGEPGIATVTPLSSAGPLYIAYDRFDEFDCYYMLEQDFTLTPLTREGDLFYRPDGSVAAELLHVEVGQSKTTVALREPPLAGSGRPDPAA